MLKFSINNMEEFTHQELQSVILRYDSEHKKNRGAIQELNEEIEDLNE